MSSGSIVKLNIGGSVFQTTKSTLAKFDGFFKIMLETDVPLEKDDAECIFIDRSSKHFELILNFMRDGEVDLPDSVKDLEVISREAQFYLLTGLVDLCNSKMSTIIGNVVKLNIGGSKFETSKSTLTKFNGMLKTMLETGVPVKKDESGCIFIDRDPQHFRLILNYMRDGDVVLPVSTQDVQEIQKEAQYYQLHSLVDLCTQNLSISLRIIQSDSQLLQIISNIKNKPVLIAYYFVKSNGFRTNLNFDFKDFLNKYKYSFDVYFKLFHTAPGAVAQDKLNTYEIYDSICMAQNGYLNEVENDLLEYLVKRFYFQSCLSDL